MFCDNIHPLSDICESTRRKPELQPCNIIFTINRYSSFDTFIDGDKRSYDEDASRTEEDTLEIFWYEEKKEGGCDEESNVVFYAYAFCSGCLVDDQNDDCRSNDSDGQGDQTGG